MLSNIGYLDLNNANTTLTRALHELSNSPFISKTVDRLYKNIVMLFEPRFDLYTSTYFYTDEKYMTHIGLILSIPRHALRKLLTFSRTSDALIALQHKC